MLKILRASLLSRAMIGCRLHQLPAKVHMAVRTRPELPLVSVGHRKPVARMGATQVEFYVGGGPLKGWHVRDAQIRSGRAGSGVKWRASFTFAGVRLCWAEPEVAPVPQRSIFDDDQF